MTGQAPMVKPGVLLREGLSTVLSLSRKVFAADRNMNKL